MLIQWIIIFAIFSLISVIFSVIIRFFAMRFGIVDKPDFLRIVKTWRKNHKQEIPLLGGVAIFFTFFIGLLYFKDIILSGNLEIRHWLGVFVGVVVLMIGGFIDDKYDLKAKWQIVWPILAALCVLLGGVGIEKITNPLGGYLYLDQYKLLVLNWQGASYYFVLISDLIVFCWLMGMMYTTKLLDGVDGLAGGVSMIAGLVIFLFTMTTKYYQPDIGMASLLFAAACFGFLVLNWHPAKIFLGEGGSLLVGFILGLLSIISGGKIAIALLVMGIPVLDVAWNIVRRLLSGKNPFKGDRKHLHHRLLDLGFSQRQTVLFFYAFSLFFGLLGLLLQSRGKFLALSLLLVLMLVMVIGFTYLERKRS